MKAKYTGRHGEDIAAKYLELQSYLVLSRNKRVGARELDIVCKKGTTLVVVEVKTTTTHYGLEQHRRLSAVQRTHLIRAARKCLREFLWAKEVRMDVIWIQLMAEGLALEHQKDAFYNF